MKIYFISLLLLPALLLGKELSFKTKKNNKDVEQTLVLIKPEAVANGHTGDIIAQYERDGLAIAGLKMVKLSLSQAKEFYQVHQEHPFYKELTEYISSGPVVAIVLEGRNAVARNRKIMGATDPKAADKGTIRSKWGTDIQRNAVHGSDSLENAKKEISFFFKPDEIVNSGNT
jgi:nucleoside-diphosphate kinase